MRVSYPVYYSLLLSVAIVGALRTLTQPLRAAAPPASAPVARDQREPATFRIQGTDATEALDQFSRQSGIALIYIVEQVRGVRTNPVEGQFRPREALDRLVANTLLSVLEDPRTGMLMIKRTPPAPEKSPPKPPEPAKPMNRSLTALVPTLLAALTGPFLSGQASAPPAEEDRAVQLSPFEVRTDRDHGYYAPDTLSGGRTNTALKDTPAAVSVINRQFIEDAAITDLYQAEIWTVNAFPTYNPSNATTGSNSRGPNFNFFSRNYFLWYIKSDSYNTERFEFGRGPNGVLFGDGNIGGLAGSMSKQAYPGKRSTVVSARADSWGGYRGTADISVPAGDRFAVRLNFLHDRSTMWQDHSDQWRDGAHLAATFKLTKKTQIRAEGELGDIKRQIYIVTYAENASYWDGSTVYNGVTPPSTTGTGVTRVNTNPNHFVDIPNTPGAGYQNWATSYRSAGSGFALRDYARTDLPTRLPSLPSRELNLMPRDARYRLKYATSTAYLEHSFSDDLFAQLAFNSTRSPYEPEGTEALFNNYYIDVNTVMPNGLPNPNFGKAYSEAQVQKTKQMNTVAEGRALVAYRFDLRWWKGNVNFIGGERFDKFDFDRRLLVQTNGANPDVSNVANEYRVRQYWDQPLQHLGVPNIPGRTFDFAKYTSVIHQRKFIDYGQIATVNKFFHDRLTVFLGGRKDKVWQTQRSFINSYHPDGTPRLGATIIPPGGTRAVAVEGAKSLVDATSTNKNYGAVFNVLPWLGVYYNYSETYAVPNAGDNLIDGSAPGLSISSSKEYGLKFNLLNGKAYADVRYYDSKQTDLLVTGTNGQINSIWTQLGRTDRNQLFFRDTQSLVLDGYEFELVANPTRNLRLMANFSRPTTHTNTNALPGLRSYYATYVDEWRAAAATNPTIQTQLNSLETVLANNASFATANNFTKYRANFYGTYSFYAGRLKGLSLGGGTNLVGPAKVGSGATPFDYLYSDSYFLLSGHVSYHLPLGRRSLRLQLNVNNILDEDDPVTTSFGAYRVGGIGSNPPTFAPNGFRLHDPRQAILSATLTF